MAGIRGAVSKYLLASDFDPDNVDSSMCVLYIISMWKSFK